LFGLFFVVDSSASTPDFILYPPTYHGNPEAQEEILDDLHTSTNDMPPEVDDDAIVDLDKEIEHDNLIEEHQW